MIEINIGLSKCLNTAIIADVRLLQREINIIEGHYGGWKYKQVSSDIAVALDSLHSQNASS